VSVMGLSPFLNPQMTMSAISALMKQSLTTLKTRSVPILSVPASTTATISTHTITVTGAVQSGAKMG
jgi:hypothetical protein